MSADPPTCACPVDAPVSVLGGKWKLPLLFRTGAVVLTAVSARAG